MGTLRPQQPWGGGMSPPVPGMPLTGSGTSLRHPTHVCPWQDPHVAHPPPCTPFPPGPPSPTCACTGAQPAVRCGDSAAPRQQLALHLLIAAPPPPPQLLAPGSRQPALTHGGGGASPMHISCQARGGRGAHGPPHDPMRAGSCDICCAGALRKVGAAPQAPVSSQYNQPGALEGGLLLRMEPPPVPFLRLLLRTWLQAGTHR